MSGLDYIHGAAAQKHISNFNHAEETERLVINANRAIDEATNRAVQAEAENERLRAELKAADRYQTIVTNGRVADTIIKDAGRDQLARCMQNESKSAHDFVVSWIGHHGAESSHEFLEGVKEGMKINMPFSTSEFMRHRFIRAFEDRARKLYNEKGENAFTIDAFNSISSDVAVTLVVELQSKMRADFKNKTGVSYVRPSPGRNGPNELRNRYGEGKFKAQEFVTKD